MSIREVPMYQVICDRCDNADDDEFFAWADAGRAVDEADASDWLITEHSHFCPDCTTWDEEADERVPIAPDGAS